MRFLIIAMICLVETLTAQVTQELQSEKNPTPQPAFSELVVAGFNLENAGNYAEAIHQYSQAIAVKKDNPTVFLRRGFAHARLGKAKEAALDFKKAASLPPKSLTDYSTMAWFFATSPFKLYRDGMKSIALATKLHKEHPSAETYDILGAAYATMGDYYTARNYVLEGIKMFPDSDRIPAMKERLNLYNNKKPYVQPWE